MIEKDIETLLSFAKLVLGIPAVTWAIKMLISHYFRLRVDNKTLEASLDKERIARQDDSNIRTKEIAQDLKLRQHELSDSFVQVSDILNQLRSEISEVKKAFSDLRLDVEKSNAKYDVLTSKFMDYIPAANKRIEMLETAFGKIIQK